MAAWQVGHFGKDGRLVLARDYQTGKTLGFKSSIPFLSWLAVNKFRGIPPIREPGVNMVVRKKHGDCS